MIFKAIVDINTKCLLSYTCKKKKDYNFDNYSHKKVQSKNVPFETSKLKL